MDEPTRTGPLVVNASPLIFLAKGGYLELLHLAGETILVPEAVAKEIRRRGPEDVTGRALRNTPWLRVTGSPPVPTLIQA